MKLFFLIVVSAVTAGLVSFGLWNFRQEGGNQGQKDALRQDESYARAKRTAVSHLEHSWLEQNPESSHTYSLNTWWRYATFTAWTQNHSTQRCPEGYNCTCNYPAFAPGDKGTQLVDKGWWLCGHNAYADLPANWSGVCAPVHLKDHTVIIYAANASSAPQLRSRRDLNDEFKPHDSVWGTDVPREFKHWPTGNKVIMTLFPWLGIGKNILRLETVDYRLKVFTNLTKVALTGVKEEMTALRLMTMQNRMALDLITAPQGGVCAMVGDYCCTFIPENDADGHLIDSALKNLTKLQRAMIDDGSPPPDWLTGMLSRWRELLFKIGMMIGIVLLVLAILACCVVPLVRGCIGRLVGSAVTSTLLQVEEQSLLDNDEEESEEEWTNVMQDVNEMFKMS
uniref:Envelope glycoprotein n=1 Tax=Takifugu rubripes TaxID=31033 RepID=A0A674NU83_TAKRU